MATGDTEIRDEQIDQLITALCSVIDGEGAIEHLIACGDRAIPHLFSFLVHEPPRIISQPRCWAVRILGELGAYPALRSYLRSYTQLDDRGIRLSEDVVRGAAAYELSRRKTEQNFQVLLDATRQRAGQGLVWALGEYERSESLPLLFELLEDQYCGSEALRALQRIPTEAKAFAILSLRGQTGLHLDLPSTSRRRRAMLMSLRELGIDKDQWADIEPFLSDSDAACVIEAAKVGLTIAEETQVPTTFSKLLFAAPKMNWEQVSETITILDSNPEIARKICRELPAQHPDFANPEEFHQAFWRILFHFLGSEINSAKVTE